MGGCCSDTTNKEGVSEGTNTNKRKVSMDDDSVTSETSYSGKDSDDGSDINEDSEEKEESDRLPPKSEKRPTFQSSSHDQVTINIHNGFRDAIAAGNESLAYTLFDDYKDYDLLSVTYDNGDNCLLKACQTRKTELVFFMLKKGMDINFQNPKTGYTALHYACEQRNLDLVKFLIANDADPTLTSNDEKLPLPRDIARRYRATKIMQLLDEHARNRALAQEHHTLSADSEASTRDRVGSIQVTRTTELIGIKPGTFQMDLIGGASYNDNTTSSNNDDNNSTKNTSDLEDEIQKEFIKQPSKSNARTLKKIQVRDPFRGGYLRKTSTKKY